MTKPLIAVSACLLGQNVRYDGQHKQDRWITDQLSTEARLTPICPEVELGLGTPREPIQLERDGARTLLKKVNSREDLTQRLLDFADKRLTALSSQHLHGYILKSKSPSCGLNGVKVFSSETEHATNGRGLFAAQLAKRLPALPLIEEDALSQELARHNFLTKVFCLSRLQALWDDGWSLRSLADFHQQHKLLLLAYSPAHYQSLQALLANSEQPNLRESYQEQFEGAFTVDASAAQHTRALQHAASYFHGALSGAGRFAIQQAILAFQEEGASLQRPLQLISTEAQRCQLEYLTQQRYLEPFPRQLSM